MGRPARRLRIGPATRVRRLGAAAACALCVAFALPSSALALDFVVDRSSDEMDHSSADDRCDVSATTLGNQCTLRAAIQQANATPDEDRVFFEPARFDGTPPPTGTSVIPLTGALPAITERVIVDGGSEGCELSPGVPKPCVQVAGRDNQVTFRVAAGGDGTEIKRLSLTSATGSEVFGTPVNGKAVQFDDEVAGGAVRGSWIGLPLNQTAGSSVSNAYGVEVLGDEIEVGGTSAGDRNVFDFNRVAGVKVSGDANETVIRGNDFGVAADGQTDKFNSADAIEVSGLDPDWVGPQPARTPTNTVIGGNVPATNQDTRCDESCNSIVNSSENAIDLHGDEQLGAQTGQVETPAGATFVGGNYIGLRPLNSVAGNGGDGVLVGGADDVTIGGPPDFPGMRNWFARNGNGVARNGDPADEGGIRAFSDAQNLKIENNWIGQRPNGQAAPDLSYGVDIGPGTLKGNTFASAGARPSNAVRLSGSQGTMTGNVVKGAAGAEGYGESGVLVTGSHNRIGGETIADRNVIGGAGAGRPGIHLRGDASDGGAAAGGSNQVLGNWLGLSETDTSMPNGGPGILVDDDADNNDVGGDSLGSRNRIHNSGGDAIEVDGADTDGTRVLQNRGADNADLFVDLRPADGPGNGTVATGANGGVQPPTVIAGGTSVRGTAAPGARILVFEKSSALSGELGPILTTATADSQGRWQVNYSRSDGAIVSVMQVAGRNSSELRQAVADAVAPQTSITSGPSGSTSDSTPTFGFSSTEPGSSFRCRVDAGPLTSCSSPRTVGPLSAGAHTFSVVATDPAGNADASAATRSFNVSGTGSGTGSTTGSTTGSVTNGAPLRGTAGNDVINGTAGDDVIECGAGNDVVNGGGGNDVIRCGAGNDVVDGGAGNDRVLGESGNDRVNGGTGRDRVGGGSGRDRVNGGAGNDRAAGDSGNDRVNGSTGNDRVSGSAGNDRLSGGRGNDRLSGGSGRDRIAGDSGNDRLSGGRGNDRLQGGRGRDRLNGGPGRDSQRQ